MMNVAGPYPEPLCDQDIADAEGAIGDDRIQESTGRINPTTGRTAHRHSAGTGSPSAGLDVVER